MPLDVTLYKNAMRRFPGGVCLITSTGKNGHRNGLTATAVCSVTVEPPTLLVCVNKSASAHDLVRESGCIAVNIVHSVDADLAVSFSSAKSGEERFAKGNWSTLITGAPVLESAAVVFDCKVEQVVDVGSHSIILGVAKNVRISENIDSPLLYLNGMYGKFQSL